MNLTTAKNLYEVLTKDYPSPWKLTYHAKESWHTRAHIASIEASNGECPITLETFTGDGDCFYLGEEGAQALVAFVNNMADQNA